MISFFAILIPSLFTLAYVVVFSIECAASLTVWRPHFFSKTMAISPVWETTSVFLVVAIVSFIAFFPGAIAVWGPLLAIPAFVFLAVQAVRVCVMLALFYGTTKNPNLVGMLVVLNSITPGILLGGTLPFFILGAGAFKNGGFSLGLEIGIVACISTVMTALLFLAARQSFRKSLLVPLTRVLRDVFGLFVLGMVCIGLTLYGIHAFMWNFYGTAIPILVLAVIIVALSLLASSKHRHFGYAWWAWLAGFATVWFVGIASTLPYVVYPSTTIASSIASPDIATLFICVSAIGCAIVIPVLAIMYKMFL